MCASGLEAFAFASAAASVAKTLVGTKKPKQPKVVQADPVADEIAAKTKAAQEAQAATLEARRRARQNSLLSQAGAASELSTTNNSAKAVLGG